MTAFSIPLIDQPEMPRHQLVQRSPARTAPRKVDLFPPLATKGKPSRSWSASEIAVE